MSARMEMPVLHDHIYSIRKAAAMTARGFVDLNGFYEAVDKWVPDKVPERVMETYGVLEAEMFIDAIKKMNARNSKRAFDVRFHFNTLYNAMSMMADSDEGLVREVAGLEARADPFINNIAGSNLGLAGKMAGNRKVRGSIPYDDAFQESFFGLREAVMRYMPESGLKFSTYAHHWLYSHLFRQRKLYRPGMNGHLRANEYRTKTTKALSAILQGRSIDEMTPADKREFEKRVGWSLERTMEFLDRNQDPLSLDKPVGPHNNITMADFLESGVDPEKLVSDSEISDRVNVLLHNSGLSQIELDIVKRRMGFSDEPMTLVEVGRIHHLSRERIRQLQDRAHGKMREAAERLL